MNLLRRERAVVACVSLFVGVIASCAGAEEPAAAATPAAPSHWRVSAAILCRQLEGVDVRPSRYITGAMVPRHASAGITGGDFSPLTESADRRYDDGYVNRDAGTPRDGLTWYWGYRDAGQVEGDTLSFHVGDATSTDVRRSVQLDDSSDDDEAYGPGFAIGLGYDVNPGSRITWGVNASLTFARFDVNSDATTFQSDEAWARQDLLVTDTYDLNGVLPPNAPYSGTLDGPGPLLSNRPSSRSVMGGEARTGEYRVWNRVSTDVGINLLTLALAPALTWNTKACSLSLQAGPTISWEQVDMERSEAALDGGSAPIAAWRDTSTESHFIGGGMVDLSVAYRLGENSSLALGGRYDWIDERECRVGPATVTVDADGVSVSAAWTYRF